jgi:Fe2+ or Zn2+ uptake regulation protein
MSRLPTSEVPTDVHGAAAARLRTIGHRYTAKRRALVDVFETARQPLSMPEVLARDPQLAQSSVYRNLAALELAGVLHRIVTQDEFARFELAEELSGHHHHHLICSSCGSVEDMELPPTVEAAVTEELARLAERRGFTPSGHQMDLVGVCADCH